MRWPRRRTVVADVGDGFLAAETAAHQAALEQSAGSGRSPGAATELAAELTVYAERGGTVVVLAWDNRNVGLVPEPALASLATQTAAAATDRARLVVSAEIFRQDGLWRVWVGPLPRPRSIAPAVDTVASKPPTIGGIPLQRPDAAR